MSLSAARRRELATMDIPSDDEVRARALEFEERSGLTRGEFSLAIGYSAGVLGMFLGGHYNVALSKDHDQAHNTLNIKAKLIAFIDKWDDVQVLLRHQAMHHTADFELIRGVCSKALANASAYVIDGPPGTQKTYSLRAFEREAKQTFGGGRVIYVYARADHSPLGFLREVCRSAGIPSKGDIDKLIRKLRFFLSQERVLLLVDETDHLPTKTLEIVRQLLDLPPYFGVVLAGNHELSATLDKLKMARWHDRVRDTLELKGPSEAECRTIICVELQPLFPDPISKETCDRVIARCEVTGVRIDRTGRKPIPRQFDYISARLLFFAIADIQQQASSGQPGAARKESIA